MNMEKIMENIAKSKIKTRVFAATVPVFAAGFFAYTLFSTEGLLRLGPENTKVVQNHTLQNTKVESLRRKEIKTPIHNLKR